MIGTATFLFIGLTVALAAGYVIGKANIEP